MLHSYGGDLIHPNSLHYGRAEAQTKTISPLSFSQFYFQDATHTLGNAPAELINLFNLTVTRTWKMFMDLTKGSR